MAYYINKCSQTRPSLENKIISLKEQKVKLSDVDKTIPISPFLKWAGGKRWLVSKYPDIFPSNCERYIEPFLGGGAVFFHFQPCKAVLADLNSELIETYKALKNDWEGVWRILNKYQNKHSVDFYYDIRSRSFNSKSEKAAQFIYLNRTCWNGLYRVNQNGQFNVPIGTKDSVIMDTDNFSYIAQLLHEAELITSDFEKIIDNAKEGDFIFIDPPYTVKHNLNGFIKYNNKIFSWDDQIRLRHCSTRAVSRGVQLIITNANHQSIKELYDGLGELIEVNRASVIAGNVKDRGVCSELVIRCGIR